MFNLNEIPKTIGLKKRKRLGRGHGSGLGKTSGKGHKGFKARSGKGKSPLFEGGQTPLARRLPIKGFNNYKFQQKYEIFNINSLIKLNEDVIDKNILIKYNIINKKNSLIKVLGKGNITKPISLYVNAYSLSAKKKIEELGGKIILIKK